MRLSSPQLLGGDEEVDVDDDFELPPNIYEPVADERRDYEQHLPHSVGPSRQRTPTPDAKKQPPSEMPQAFEEHRHPASPERKTPVLPRTWSTGSDNNANITRQRSISASKRTISLDSADNVELEYNPLALLGDELFDVPEPEDEEDPNEAAPGIPDGGDSGGSDSASSYSSSDASSSEPAPIQRK